MDEPTTGLHMSDITGILTIIDRLVDVGFEGGSRGGQIIFEGTPGNLRNCKESITAKYL